MITSTARRGSEVFGVELAEALHSFNSPSQMVALARRRSGPELAVPVLGETPLGPRTISGLRRASRHASVVVAHGSSTLPACAAATLGRRTPFVYRSIGDPTYWANTIGRRLRSAVLLHRASVVVALWGGAAETLQALYRLPVSRLAVIPNGVPVDRFPLVDAERRHGARSRLGIVGERPTVAYLGSLSYEKNVPAAVAAIVASTDLQLLVVGDGPDRPAVEALGRAVAPARISVVPGTNDPATVLAASDVLMLPSLTEGMPAVLIEAGLSGIPVVASDVGGVGEIVRDRVTGRLVPAGDMAALTRAIQDVVRDPGTLGQAARAHCLKHFDLRVVAEAWDAVLRPFTEFNERERPSALAVSQSHSEWSSRHRTRLLVRKR